MAIGVEPGSTALNTLVLIPCNNEAEGLDQLLSDLPGAPWRRFVVVDDASADGTADIVKEHAVECIRTDEVMGRDGALRHALGSVLDADTNLVVFMDGDGQHPPQFISDFEAAIAQGFLIVNGARFTGQSEQRSTPPDRVFLAQVLSASLRSMTGWCVSDPACGFLGVRAPLLRRLLPIMDFRGHLSVEMVVRAAQIGVPNQRFLEIPISAIYDGTADRQLKKYQGLSWEERLIPRTSSHIMRLYKWLEPCYQRAQGVTGATSPCYVCSDDCLLRIHLAARCSPQNDS